jgi:hypothetical protein
MASLLVVPGREPPTDCRYPASMTGLGTIGRYSRLTGRTAGPNRGRIAASRDIKLLQRLRQVKGIRHSAATPWEEHTMLLEMCSFVHKKECLLGSIKVWP